MDNNCGKVWNQSNPSASASQSLWISQSEKFTSPPGCCCPLLSNVSHLKVPASTFMSPLTVFTSYNAVCKTCRPSLAFTRYKEKEVKYHLDTRTRRSASVQLPNRPWPPGEWSWRARFDVFHSLNVAVKSTSHQKTYNLYKYMAMFKG